MKRRIDMVNTIFKGKSAFSLLVLAVSGLVGAVESPRIVAHRGNFQYDDNALGGFLQSLDAGVTGFETDVQMTSDGWSGQRYFTNDVPWSSESVLEGTEGLGKWGERDLTLSAKSSFTGDVLLAGGTILLTTPGNDVNNTEVGALGNPRVARTVVVSNATLRMVEQNSFGGSGRSTTPIRTVLKFVNSTLDLTTNFTFNAGDVYLHDSQVKFHGGLNHWAGTTT